MLPGAVPGVVVGKLHSLATLDMIDSFSFGYEFHALESACMHSRNTEEKSGSGLAEAHTAIFNMSAHPDHSDPIHDISVSLPVALPAKADPRCGL